MRSPPAPAHHAALLVALAPAGVRMEVLVVVVLAHRLVSTAQEVLQVSADSSSLCNTSCSFLCLCRAFHISFLRHKTGSLGRAASQLLL